MSRERNEDFNLTLTRYTVERLLYRLTRSTHAEKFVLKGAMLIAVWMGRSHRPTRDVDLLGFGGATGQHLKQVFQQVCQTQVADDGLVFEADSIEVSEIREGQAYPGERVKLTAKLGNARIRIQVDVGFGDVVTPKAVQIEYPVLLDFPAPRIRAYPKETVVAEKLQTMVLFGMVNSRMKDFYDLHTISRAFSFDGSTLVRAIRATFSRRGTKIPTEIPIALSDESAYNPDKITQWKAFLSRNGLENTTVSFSLLVDELRAFLAQPLFAAAYDETFQQNWPAGGPWSNTLEAHK
ncbi:MAG: nucleotidyl transferase AbiEii/AbiGii toxin family protein [Candidatus Zixiibacteriota bacterium]